MKLTLLYFQRFDLKSLKHAIADLIDEAGWREAVSSHAAITLWPEVVGATVARHSEALEVQNGTLVVKTKNPTWRNEIAFQKDEILMRLNDRLENFEIKDIRFK